MYLLHFLSSILGFGMNIMMFFIKLILIAIIAGISLFKGYNPWIFSIIALVTPWPVSFIMVFLLPYLPKKLPKFPSHIKKHPAFENKNPVVASIMALSATIAKADGSISKDEIRFIKQFISQYFGISMQEINDYADAFNYGKEHPEEYMAFTQMILGYYRTRRDYVIALAYMFVGLTLQEEGDTTAKEEQAKRIILGMGLTEYEYQAMRMAYMNQRNGYSQSYQQSYGGYSNSYTSQDDLIKKYTQVLGVSEDASMSEIKRAYRKLVKEYHPDKLNSGSVPQEYIEFANQKIRDINEAYEYLEKVKGNS